MSRFDAPERRLAARQASRRVGWMEHLVRAAEQALDDVVRSGASEVVLVRHGRGADARAYLEQLEDAAVRADVVVAHVAMSSESAFDALDGLVQAIVRGLRAPSAARSKPGFPALLDAFIGRLASGARSDPARELDARLSDALITGSLATLARMYVASKSAARTEAKRIDAWLGGADVGPSEDPAGFEALSARTAKRTFVDLSRMVVALGWRGTLVVVEDVDLLTRVAPGRRQAAYTVLRELIDNADGGRGLVATEIVLCGSRTLASGPRSIEALRPLEMRVEAPAEAFTEPPTPHRTLIELAGPEDAAGARAWSAKLPLVRPAPDGSHQMLRALVRASHGLPPTEATASMSVGSERIDASIDVLFEHSRAEGSVFALITGAYGAGKTHFLLHLAARALADDRPVFRLSLERLERDLGHPERHLARLLEHATLPGEARASPLECMTRWTRSDAASTRLVGVLETVAEAGGDAGDAADRALTIARRSEDPGTALEVFLGARDLAARTPSPSARRDAYARILLWLELLERLEGCAGPVLLVDEVENLYRGGASLPERRTALRTLSFYCGGALPRACVVLAVTPDALVELRAEAPTLLEDVAEQKSLLSWEDASMFCRRLVRAKPLVVPALGADQREALAERVRKTHAAVRGRVHDPEWRAFLGDLAGHETTPRELVRRTVDRLERIWWWETGAKG